MNELPDDLDSLHLLDVDRSDVLEALAADAARDGMTPADPDELLPFGRWFGGEEDPTVRRYVVSPPAGRWTRVLTSTIDWFHDWTPRLVQRLDCRAAYFMLHDADVFTLHLHEADRLVAEYVSSPVHFDHPTRREGDLGVDLEAVRSFCRAEVTTAEVVAALSPPGPIDVDGRRAMLATADLFGIGAAALASYACALADDALTLRPELAGCDHLAFRFGDDEDEDEHREDDEPSRRPPPTDDGLLRFPT